MGHSENNEQPNGKCSKGFGVASWTMVEMMKWIDGNLHVEVRVAVGMENQIVDVWSTADLITTKTRTRRTRKLVNEREERRKRTEWKEQKTVNNETKLN